MIVSPSSLGGVPVLSLPICNLNFSNCSLNPVEGFSSNRPAGVCFFPIRINQIHPGIIETDMGKQVEDSRIIQNPNMSKKQSYNEGIKQTPIGRLGGPNEIAQGILYLASNDSSFMTGSSLVVDGGLTAQ